VLPLFGIDIPALVKPHHFPGNADILLRWIKQGYSTYSTHPIAGRIPKRFPPNAIGTHGANARDGNAPLHRLLPAV
jgi:hypothetical protein